MAGRRGLKRVGPEDFIKEVGVMIQPGTSAISLSIEELKMKLYIDSYMKT